MELAFVIWAVGTLPMLAGMVCFATFVLLILAGVAWGITSIFAKVEKKEEDIKECESVAKMSGKVFLWVLPIWFIFMLVPDKTTSYQMLAAYGVQKVIENPKAQEFASDGVDVLSALMKKAKAELTEKTK